MMCVDMSGVLLTVANVGRLRWTLKTDVQLRLIFLIAPIADEVLLGYGMELAKVPDSARSVKKKELCKLT